MAMPFDYSRPRNIARPLTEVDPIISATNPLTAIRQIFEFAARHETYRIGVPDTSYFPFSAICKMVMTFPFGTYSRTGFYIGRNLVLSCGHNLFNTVPGGGGTEAATALTIRPGQQNGSTYLHSFTVSPEDWTVHPQWVSSAATDRGHDLSVIRVPNPAPRDEWFEIANFSPTADAPLAVCGYGGQDVDSSRQHLDIDRVRGLSASGEVVEYNLQSRRGNSGSPVFIDFTNRSTNGAAPQTIPVMGVMWPAATVITTEASC